MANWFHELELFLFAVLAHWQALVTGGLVTAGIAIYEKRKNENVSWKSYVLFISAFLLYSVFAAWQDEHRNTESVITDKSALSSQLGTCAADLKSARGTLKDKQSLADSLQQVFIASQQTATQQGANMATCINSLTKLNPQVHRETRAIVYQTTTINTRTHQMGVTPDPDVIYGSMVVITTNQLEQKASGMLSCGTDFQVVSMPVLTSLSGHGFVGGSTPVKISNREYFIAFPSAPSLWGPTTPILVTISSSKEQMRDCSFTEQ